MANVIPPGAKWVKDRVVSFDPKSSQVATASSGKLDYDFLVVASGTFLSPFFVSNEQTIYFFFLYETKFYID